MTLQFWLLLLLFAANQFWVSRFGALNIDIYGTIVFINTYYVTN